MSRSPALPIQRPPRADHVPLTPEERFDAILDARATHLAVPLTDDSKSGSETSALLVFLGPEMFAIETRHLVEILTNTTSTKIPGAAPSIEGVVAYRGRVMPVLNLADLLESGSGSKPDTRRILVVSAQRKTIGLSVDAIGEIMGIRAFEDGATSAFREGMFPRFTRKSHDDGPWIIRMDLLFSHPVMKGVISTR